MVQDRVHLQIVRQHQPLELELAAEQVGQDGRGQRGRALWVQGRIADVRRHDGREAVLEAVREGPQLDLVQPVERSSLAVTSAKLYARETVPARPRVPCPGNTVKPLGSRATRPPS